MGRWPLGAAGAAAFVLGVAMILPPTELKSSWTNVHYATPERVWAPPQEAESFPVTAGVAADEPATEAAPAVWREPDARSSEDLEAIRLAEGDRAYGDGYAWASDRGIEDAGACRRFRGPRAEGCRDYVASLAPAEPERDREEEPVSL